MPVKRPVAMALCTGVFLAAAAAQSPGKGAISGTVLDGVSGDPVRKAIVTLTLEGSPRRWATARTDSSGHFEFTELPAGKYELWAGKGTGEGIAIYGADRFGELGDLIALNDGETRSGLKLRFLRSASISGHVYDSDGDPAASASLQLLRYSRDFGEPVLMQYRFSSTDDRGEFRIPY